MASKTIKIANFKKLKARKHNWISNDWKVKKMEEYLNEYFILLESEKAVGELKINKSIYYDAQNIPYVDMEFTYTNSTTNRSKIVQIPVDDLKSFYKFIVRVLVLIEMVTS